MADPAVKVLLAMGFPRDRVVAALLETNNRLEEALEILASTPEPEPLDYSDEGIARRLARQMEDERRAFNGGGNGGV
jgi:hypothetical protein